MDNVEKRLKNKDFALIDSSICCALFVLFQLLFDVFYMVIPSSVKGNIFVAIIASILAEGVFFFAAWATSGTRKVALFKASKITSKVDYKSALLAVGMSLVCLIGFNGLTNLFVGTLEGLGYHQQISEVVISNFGVYMLYVLTLCIVPAVCEEICFRGCILNGMRGLGDHKAVWLSAAIFMLMHGGPDQTVHQMIVGVICGYALIFSGSLLVPMIIHFCNNFFAVTIIYVQGMFTSSSAEAAAPASGPMAIAISVISAVALACVATYLILQCFKQLKKWKAAREADPQVEAEKANGALQTEDINAKKKNNIITVTMFAASVAYLVFNWLITLVSGFVL